MERSFGPPVQPFKTPEEEVAYLRKRLEAHEQGISGQVEKPARAVLESYQKTPTHQVLAPTHQLSKGEIEGIVLNLAPEEHDEKMGELLSLMQQRGIKNALAVAEKLGAHVLDDFHRFLIEYLKEGYAAKGLTERKTLWQPFHMSLYEVALPKTGDEKRTLKESLSAMEQLYSALLAAPSGKNKNKMYVSLEIAVSHDAEDVVFYVSVQNEQRSLFEKQAASLFPGARVIERTNDYNIFNPTGVSVGSYAKLAKHAALPLRTYDMFDHDPLDSVLAAMSRLKRVGEGAAVQFIVSNAPPSIATEYKRYLERLEKGEKPAQVLQTSSTFGKVVSELLFGTQKKKKEEVPVIDKLVIEQIANKIKSPLASAVVRLVTSAPGRARAEAMLLELESAFAQYEEAQGNKLVFRRPRGASLRALLKDFSFRAWNSFLSIKLNLRELTSLYHLSGAKITESRELKRAKSKEAPVPLELPSEGVLLGYGDASGELIPVHFAPEDRLRHFYVVGQTGTGKTNFLKSLIQQDIERGEGVCMIDPHGTDIKDVLGSIPPERAGDVIYFDPSDTARPLGLNMLEFDPRYPEQKTFIVNELLNIFNKLFDMKVAGGPAFEQYFRNSALLVMEHPESGNTLFDIGRVLGDKSFRDLKLSHAKNPTIVEFWKNAEATSGEQSLANYVQYVTNKFDVFTTNEIMRPIVAQRHSSLNFRDIIDTKKILLVNLSKGRLGDLNSYLLGLLVVGKLLMAALSRVDSSPQNLPPFYLYIDEFQNVTTDSIVTILSEARKYKLGLTLAHQFIKQVPENIRDAVFGNVGSIAVLRVGNDDAQYLEKQFTPTLSASDFLNLDNFHAYVKLLVNGRPSTPFSLKLNPAKSGDARVIEELRELSALTYGRPKAEIERELQARYAH